LSEALDIANWLTDFLLKDDRFIWVTLALIAFAFAAYYFRGRKPETKDLRETIRADRSLVEKIAFYIPVYHGYREREDRRDADKLLRDYVARKLKDVQKDLKEVYRSAMAADLTELSAKLDSAIALFDKLRSRIEHADYGYASLWGALKIREEELDRMYELDERLVKYPEVLSARVEALSRAVESENIKKASTALADLVADLRKFDKAFGERKDYILKVSNVAA
jgi:hypothetical protein